MESIQQAITGAVPSLTAEKVTAVMTELQSKGFFGFDDLRYIDCEKIWLVFCCQLNCGNSLQR
jgi:hypothetical protein